MNYNNLNIDNQQLIDTSKKQRETGVELLRVVLMFMIVCFHLFSFYIQGAFYINQPMYLSKLTFTTLCVMGVDCFVFISGYYGIKFKLKQVASLFLQAWSVSYICLIGFSVFSDFILPKDFYINYLLPVSSSMWWFFTAYILLYFISPFLNAGINSFSKKQFQIFLGGFLFFNCFANYIFDLQFGGHFVNFIFIYLLGRYINIYKINLKRPFLLYILTLVVMFALDHFVGIYLDKPVLFAIRYASILTIFSAICLFFTFKNIKMRADWILKISPLCFGVYLFHFNYYTWNFSTHPFLYKIEILYKHNQPMFILSTLLLAISIFIICLVCEKIRQIICKPILNVINNKIDKLKLDI